MSTVIVRYQTHPESADTNQHLIEQVFAELADGVTFVHVASTEGDKSPLEDVTAFKEFQRDIKDRLQAPPEFQDATLIGEYSDRR